MVKIASYVFFDIETTGLPYQERNKTKIIELSFVAVLRNDLENAVIGTRPYVSKLTVLFNPQRQIHPVASSVTGITDDMLTNKPIFKENAKIMLSFLKNLPAPVCLIAHNGNVFDYKILLAEFMDINVALPEDLLCVDSLQGFKTLHKQNYPKISSNTSNSFEDSKGSEDWPDLNISTEDWNEIDSLCESFSEIDPFENVPKVKKSRKSEKVKVNDRLSFKLTDLYIRLLGKDVTSAHRAEDDCMMLLECVTAAKEFLIWSDKYCKNINSIKPLTR